MQIIREIKNAKPIKNREDANSLLSEFKNQDREHFIVIGLDTKLKPIYREIAHIGTLDSSLMHPREVFKKAIVMSSNSIIVAHNHPSGSTEPSEEDKRVHKRLIEAGKLLNIPVLDCLIIGDEITSFIDEI